MTDDKPPLLGRQDAVPRRRWQWLLPTIVGVAVVALGAAVFVRVTRDDGDAAAPRTALVAYLEAVQTGATRRAYGMLCADKAKPTYEAFDKGIDRERAASGGVVRHRIGDVESRSGTVASATYTVQFERTYKWVAAALVKQDGEWKLCGFKEIPRPELRLPADEIPVPPGFADTSTTTTTR